ncbi:MAG: AMP-binding protein [Candidatus Riflebacteria bacterium]|nr:AMP-binding protein [Candidatus Riflebacteria bacterium]
MNSIEKLSNIQKIHEKSPLLVDSFNDRIYSYSEVSEFACWIAFDLQRRGLKKGDKVAIILNNSIFPPIIYLACLYAGFVAIPINPIFGNKEIEEILQKVNPNLVILSVQTFSIVKAFQKQPLPISVLILQDGLQHSEDNQIDCWEIKAFKEKLDFIPFSGVNENDSVLIVFSSGTTGTPNGIVHNLRSLVANASIFIRTVGILENHRFLANLPATYLGGYYNLFLIPFLAGGSIVVVDAFNAASAINFWKPVKKYQVNALWLVPTIIAILMETDRGKEGEIYCRNNLKLALVGTAPLSVTQRIAFEKRYGLNLLENYGLSETLFISSNSPKFPVISGSTGKILSTVQVSIMDDQCAPLGRNIEGEVYVQTPFLMTAKVFFDMDSPTEFDSNQWFSTGDLGVLSDSGELFITGRKKDLIICGGVNISPVQIENIVYSHSGVNECAVIGIPHKIMGEEIVLVLRIKKGFSFERVSEELKEIFEEKLSRIKRPSKFFELEIFPRASSGKISKRKIVNLISNREGRNIPNFNFPILPPFRNKKIFLKETFERPDSRVLTELEKYSCAFLTDCGANSPRCDLKWIYPGSFCGPVFIIEPQKSLRTICYGLKYVRQGDIVLIGDPTASIEAIWDIFFQKFLEKIGAKGVIVDGFVRRVSLATIPIYAKGCHSELGLGGEEGGKINLPYILGGLEINSGDIIKADFDGFVVIPPKKLKAILEKADQRTRLEDEISRRLNSGETIFSLLGIEENRVEVEFHDS